MINRLIKLANYLNESGFKREADDTSALARPASEVLPTDQVTVYEQTDYVEFDDAYGPDEKRDYWLDYSMKFKKPVENYSEESGIIQNTFDEFITDYAPNTIEGDRLLGFLKQYPFFKKRLLYIHAFELEGTHFGQRYEDWEGDVESLIETDEDLYYYFYEWFKKEVEKIKFYFIRGPDSGPFGTTKTLAVAVGTDMHFISYEEVCTTVDGVKYYCDKELSLEGWKSANIESKKTIIYHELQHAFSVIFGSLMRRNDEVASEQHGTIVSLPFVARYNETREQHNSRVKEYRVKAAPFRKRELLEEERSWRVYQYERDSYEAARDYNDIGNNLPINTPKPVRPVGPWQIDNDKLPDLSPQFPHLDSPGESQSLAPQHVLRRIFVQWDKYERPTEQESPYNGITVQVFGSKWLDLLSDTIMSEEEQRAYLKQYIKNIENTSVGRDDFGNKLHIFIGELCKEKEFLASKMREIEGRFYVDNEAPLRYNQEYTGPGWQGDAGWGGKEVEDLQQRKSALSEEMEGIEREYFVYDISNDKDYMEIDWGEATRLGSKGAIRDRERLRVLRNELWDVDDRLSKLFDIEHDRKIEGLDIIPNPGLKEISKQQMDDNYNELIRSYSWSIWPTYLYALRCDDESALTDEFDNLVIRETDLPTYTRASSITNKLIKLANSLDEFGATEEADEVDELIEEMVEDDEYDVEPDSPEDVEPEEIEAYFDEDDDKQWYLSRGVLNSPSGNSYRVRQIRRGTFSKVYEIDGSPGDMLINTLDKTVDKDILSDMYEEEVSDNPDDINPHLPAVRQIGRTSSGKLFIMKKYKMPLRKDDSESWEDYLLIKRCWEEAQEIVKKENAKFLQKKQFGYHELGHAIFQKTVDCAVDNNVKESIVEALEALRDAAMLYGATYSFEISPRNVGTDENGNLVLVDVIFDMKSMHDMPWGKPVRWQITSTNNHNKSRRLS